jgi:hypothetical protein
MRVIETGRRNGVEACGYPSPRDRVRIRETLPFRVCRAEPAHRKVIRSTLSLQPGREVTTDEALQFQNIGAKTAR